MQNRLHTTQPELAPGHPPASTEVVTHGGGLGRLEDSWEGPTVRELADRVEHQFGEAPALSGIYTLGFGSDEPLSPSDVHQVCDLLGLPAEDFGVDV